MKINGIFGAGARPTPTFSWMRGQGQFAFLPAVLCLALFWPFGGGGKKVQMMAGKDTPAARGTVIVDTGKNGNTALDIKAQSLAPPSALKPAENVYVVWVQSPGEAPKNLGQLMVNPDESAELKTKTPYKRFEVFITAEGTAQVEEPQGTQVLSATISRG